MEFRFEISVVELVRIQGLVKIPVGLIWGTTHILLITISRAVSAVSQLMQAARQERPSAP